MTLDDEIEEMTPAELEQVSGGIAVIILPA